MSKLRIIVTGMVGQYPLGGVAWDYLQYAIGFKQLGHEVYYHEDTRNWPFDPVQNQSTSDPAYSVNFLKNFFAAYAPDMNNCWHYRHLGKESFGLSDEQFKKVAASCDIYLNISGTCQLCELLPSSCVKVFLDTDPGFNQIVLHEQMALGENIHSWSKSVLEEYDRYFTYAENIYGQDCRVPRLGIPWRVTRMPIVMNLWDIKGAAPISEQSAWTTVMTWNNFGGKLRYNDEEYGSKDCEFEKIIALPHSVARGLTVAMGGKNAPKDRLKQLGWQVVDGPAETLQPDQYQHFIARSYGEFSIAKNIYVAMRTGWFSCRSACYLAAGKPIVVQDTGFSKIIPTGDGILVFNTLSEAVVALKKVEQDYSHHAQAARDLAREYFASDKVLAALIEDIYTDETNTERKTIS